MTVAAVPWNIDFCHALRQKSCSGVYFLHLNKTLDFITTEIQSCLTVGLDSAASTSHASNQTYKL